MSDQPSDLSKWAGAALAAVAAGGGYNHVVSNQESMSKAVLDRVDSLGARMRQNDAQTRDYERDLAKHMAELEIRLSVIEEKMGRKK